MPKVPVEFSSNGEARIDDIVPALAALAVNIGTLTLDPNNARLHNERNIEAIKESLRRYGQVKPVVARRSNRVVIAGNGTLQAAREMGWTKLAVSWVDLSD